MSYFNEIFKMNQFLSLNQSYARNYSQVFFETFSPFSTVVYVDQLTDWFTSTGYIINIERVTMVSPSITLTIPACNLAIIFCDELRDVIKRLVFLYYTRQYCSYIFSSNLFGLQNFCEFMVSKYSLIHVSHSH